MEKEEEVLHVEEEIQDSNLPLNPLEIDRSLIPQILLTNVFAGSTADALTSLGVQSYNAADVERSIYQQVDKVLASTEAQNKEDVEKEIVELEKQLLKKDITEEKKKILKKTLNQKVFSPTRV